jgi:S1-C subfamily serine protease
MPIGESGAIVKFLSVVVVMCLVQVSVADDLAKHLQEISVTVNAGNAEGSGVIITRDLKLNADSTETRKVNFVWTAAHVVDGLRSVRTVIDSKGNEKKTVEFKEARVVKELIEDGRKVGELKIDAQVIQYSDAENGQDLALLMLRKQGFVADSAKFYPSNEPVAIGTSLFHVGSLLGQAGANSMTAGIVSQVGRVLDIGKGGGAVFDQTTVTAFPGSSGGGVFLAADGDNKGAYVGMLTRGAGEQFNMIVPVRRMREWCKDKSLLWAIDETVPCPTLEEMKKFQVEDSAMEANLKAPEDRPQPKEFPFLIRTPSTTENKK